MNFIDTELFGVVPEPNNLTEILQLISSHAGDRRNIYLWRGQANIAWPIHSSAYRRLSIDRKVTEIAMQSYEKYLLDCATHEGYRCENGNELSDFELLAKLQHHGAATRLIDCSRNVLVALWFCCSSELDKTGLLFGIHCNYLGGGECEPESRKYDEIFYGLEKFNHPQTWQPPVVSKRIAAQSAQFLFSTVSDSPRGSLAIEDKYECVISIAIKPSLKSQLLEYLEGTFDIRHLTLFPDIDGFGYAHSFRFQQYKTQRW